MGGSFSARALNSSQVVEALSLLPGSKTGCCLLRSMTRNQEGRPLSGPRNSTVPNRRKGLALVSAVSEAAACAPLPAAFSSPARAVTGANTNHKASGNATEAKRPPRPAPSPRSVVRRPFRIPVPAPAGGYPSNARASDGRLVPVLLRNAKNKRPRSPWQCTENVLLRTRNRPLAPLAQCSHIPPREPPARPDCSTFQMTTLRYRMDFY